MTDPYFSSSSNHLISHGRWLNFNPIHHHHGVFHPHLSPSSSIQYTHTPYVQYSSITEHPSADFIGSSSPRPPPSPPSPPLKEALPLLSLSPTRRGGNDQGPHDLFSSSMSPMEVEGTKDDSEDAAEVTVALLLGLPSPSSTPSSSFHHRHEDGSVPNNPTQTPLDKEDHVPNRLNKAIGIDEDDPECCFLLEEDEPASEIDQQDVNNCCNWDSTRFKQ
ncbi:hypothetical protein SAY87_019456 [Trapa incisa]|uniref:Uncharacterized protein n=1 Tax=Trapa incisa TaxID=236973 RepID=A0AAN7K7L4_9MYRT|nr:hypothetical protein SAY87_019456 [Trapa incisa]